MAVKKLSQGVVHTVPVDLKKVLLVSEKALETWEDITPIARNEWICWVEFAKKEETRLKKLKRIVEDLEKGERRPCCWAGCQHRNK